MSPRFATDPPGCQRERVKGIEPSSSAWKAIALPLSYTRPTICGTNLRDSGIPLSLQWGVQDSNLRRLSQRIYSPSPLTTRETPRTHPHSAKGSRPRLLKHLDSALLLLTDLPAVPNLPLRFSKSPVRSQRRESNPRPADYKSAALPTELRWLVPRQRLSPRCENQLIYRPRAETQYGCAKNAKRAARNHLPGKSPPPRTDGSKYKRLRKSYSGTSIFSCSAASRSLSSALASI